MRKIKNFAMMLVMMMAAAVSFTSCEIDGDVHRSTHLSGIWEGDFGMYYEHPRYGRFDSYDTYIEFYPDYDYATHGYGKQCDWYAKGPYEYQYYTFNWEIYNGVIYLSYPYDHNLDTEIYDYSMSGSYFSGYFGGSNSRFRLRKCSDYYWSNYHNNYDYGWRDGYYYAKTRAVDGQPEEGMRRGNRFTEAETNE